MTSSRKPRRSERFVIALTLDDEILVHLQRESGAVVKFSVQYRARIRGEWQPLVRFDTAHQHAHKDICYPDGAQETQELELDNYGIALTHALRDVKMQWEFYRERYERLQNGT